MSSLSRKTIVAGKGASVSDVLCDTEIFNAEKKKKGKKKT